ncbi:hypothetical protein Dimus_016499, partial [Dionaea muscipula]
DTRIRTGERRICSPPPYHSAMPPKGGSSMKNNQKRIEYLIRRFEQENLRSGGRWGNWDELFPLFQEPLEGGSSLAQLLQNYPFRFVVVVNEKGEREYDTSYLSRWSDLLPLCKNLGEGAQKIQELLNKNRLNPNNEPVPMKDWARILPKFDDQLIGFLKIRRLMGYPYCGEREEEREILWEDENPEGSRYPWVRWQELVPHFNEENRFDYVYVIDRLIELNHHFQQYGRPKSGL